MLRQVQRKTFKKIKLMVINTVENKHKATTRVISKCLCDLHHKNVWGNGKVIFGYFFIVKHKFSTAEGEFKEVRNLCLLIMLNILFTRWSTVALQNWNSKFRLLTKPYFGLTSAFILTLVLDISFFSL